MLGIAPMTPLRIVVIVASVLVIVTAWTAGHWLVLTVAVAAMILALLAPARDD